MTDLTGATVAITGGTGSFGSTMARHLLTRGVGAVHVLSRDEAKQHDMRVAFSDDRLKFFLGDVRDRASVDAAFVGADYVFHAAALKQVPSCEFFPDQAVKTNVVGSANVVDAAAAAAFVGLLWPRLRERQAIAVAAASAVVAAALLPLLPAGVPVIVAALVGIAVGATNALAPEDAAT